MTQMTRMSQKIICVIGVICGFLSVASGPHQRSSASICGSIVVFGIIPSTRHESIVMPAKAGIQAGLWGWIPAFAGMTEEPLVIIGQSRLSAARGDAELVG